MNYTAITAPNHRGKRVDGLISIKSNKIYLTAQFKKLYGLKEFAILYTDDDGFLCFRFFDERQPDSFNVLKYRESGGALITLPRCLWDCVDYSAYNVKERDGYFVTDCKIKK